MISDTKKELNFDEIREIGQEGKNSTVYLAKDLQLDANIVVKRISKASLPLNSDFFKEAKILYASSHPFVIKVIYGCFDEENVYLAMPFYKNGSLKKLIDSRFLTIREVIRYSIQFLSGLHNIHSKGLIHFDIKPDNILISDSNEALLSDFGLAKYLNQIDNEAPFVYGKHVPPEILNGQNPSISSDIFMAGLTLYRLINGNVNFDSQIREHNGDLPNAILNGIFPDRNKYLAHVPYKLIKVIKKAIDPNPPDRYTSVLDLINEISSVDNNLDWKFSESPNNKKWILEYPDKVIEVKLINKQGNLFDIESNKTMLASSKKTKIGAHTYKDLKSTNYFSKLKSVLLDLSS